MGENRFIVHVDMDAFFAAIEQRDQPALNGKPVVVGADPKGGRGRGVVSTCSYEARVFGIHSAMPISQAYRRCPHAVFLPPRMHVYSRESHRIFTIMLRFTPDIEPVSIDEAFLDITASHQLFGTPEETCRLLKRTIREETGLTASVGMAPNKMTAKIASDLEKPDGMVVVTPAGLRDFLNPLPVEKLWGVGRQTQSALKKIGILTIGDLAAREIQDFVRRFGKSGEHAWLLANGIDPRGIKPVIGVKSVSNEHTFDQDESDPSQIRTILMTLSEKVSRRMRQSGLRGRTITLKIRFSDFKTYTRAFTLSAPTNFIEDIFSHAARLAEAFDPGKNPVRLLGVKVSNLADPEDQLPLFGEGSTVDQKKERLHQALDKIKDRFGEKSIKLRDT